MINLFRTSRRLFGFLAFWLAGASFCLAQQIVVTPNKPDGVYKVNEPVIWRVQVSGGKTPLVTQAHYILKRCGRMVIHEGTIDLSNGFATLQTSLDQPGALLVEFDVPIGSETIRRLGGAAIAPEQIQPSSPPPEDFDQFWAGQIKKLHEVPANPQLTVPPGFISPDVQYYKIRMDNIWGTHIYGQLAEPKREGKFPALLILQWAGVYGLPADRVTQRGRQGWLALNIMPHDLPFDEPAAYYKKIGNTTLKNYWTFGSDDRYKSYFLRMYLSAYRAAEYLTSRPDWDGKTLVVMGTSQGGQQTIMLSGLYPKVTAMMALVPSSCDVTGWKLGRGIGYPSWADQAEEKNNPAILETARYFDPVNFASHITCPALVSMGLLDETSPPSGVFAAINQMKGPRQVLPLALSDHQGLPNHQAAFNLRAERWLRALVKGETPPGLN